MVFVWGNVYLGEVSAQVGCTCQGGVHLPAVDRQTPVKTLPLRTVIKEIGPSWGASPLDPPIRFTKTQTSPLDQMPMSDVWDSSTLHGQLLPVADPEFPRGGAPSLHTILLYYPKKCMKLCKDLISMEKYKTLTASLSQTGLYSVKL